MCVCVCVCVCVYIHIYIYIYTRVIKKDLSLTYTLNLLRTSHLCIYFICTEIKTEV